MSNTGFGVSFETDGPETRPTAQAEFSDIGLALVAPDKAGGLEFNRPYAVNSNDVDFYTALGVGGNARAEIEGINDQLSEFRKSAKLSVVLVDEGDNADPAVKLTETLNNLKGDSVQKTGIHAWKNSAQLTGRTPRLCAVPGYTSQQTESNVANIVCAELPAVLNSLMAVAFVDGPNSTRQAALDWRETMSSKRLIPIETAVKVANSDGDVVVAPASSRVAALQLGIDQSKDGLPFHTAAMRALNIVGPGREMEFDLADFSTEGQELYNNNLGIVVRGEAGSDSAAAEGGFVYIGTDTCSTDPLWRFYNQVRGRDYLHVMAIRDLRNLLGKYNISIQLAQTWITMQRARLNMLVRKNAILGFQVQFVADENDPLDIRKGRLSISMDAEESAPFVHGHIKSGRYSVAVDEFVSDLIAGFDQQAI
ncbi:phage tail protein [Maritalea porphyrae]|uniref:phage tail protein n=1 Tax=Maritalea porphyrae TaxID=880732 RepID=UPI0022B03E29|nr:phage tail protein [Maritalea porphyrae]MCZ4272465.1 phage tail protein [Maritalea porphyrae]